MVAAGLVALACSRRRRRRRGRRRSAPRRPRPPPANAPTSPRRPSRQPAARADPPPQPTLRAPAPPRRYGDKGSIELGLGLDVLVGGGIRGAAALGAYFVVDGVAPGIEATFVAAAARPRRYGVLLGALRLVPIRTELVRVCRDRPRRPRVRRRSRGRLGRGRRRQRAVSVLAHRRPRARVRGPAAPPGELLRRSRRLRHPRPDHRRPLRILSPLDGGAPVTPYVDVRCGINSVGRVSASQAECRRFEPDIPLKKS